MAPIPKPITLEEEYKKKTGITPQDIAKLRSWLDTQPHLPGEFITDMDLILTYHCCNRSPEVSKQVLDLHFTLRTLFTNIFKNRIIDKKAIQIHKYYLFTVLETRAYCDSKILYTRLYDYDPKVFVFHEAIRCVFTILDTWQYIEGTWPGFMIVIDFDKVTLTHITKLDLTTVQQFLYYLQEAMLVKLKALHFINAPPFMDKVMMILRPFMKKELLDMLVIHQVGAKTLDKYIPPEALPREGGGKGVQSLEEAQAIVIERLEAYADYIESENKKRVTESARPGKPKTITDIFGGIEGSFKKLDID